MLQRCNKRHEHTDTCGYFCPFEMCFEERCSRGSFIIQCFLHLLLQRSICTLIWVIINTLTLTLSRYCVKAWWKLHFDTKEMQFVFRVPHYWEFHIFTFYFSLNCHHRNINHNFTLSTHCIQVVFSKSWLIICGTTFFYFNKIKLLLI